MSHLNRLLERLSITGQSVVVIAGTIFLVALLNGLLFIALVVHPSVDRSARDFSDLLFYTVLLVEEAVDDPGHVSHMLEANQLRLGDPMTPLDIYTGFDPYLSHLQRHIRSNTGNHQFRLRTSVADGEERFYWVDLDISDRTVRLGFSGQRAHLHFGWSLVLLFLLWTALTLAGTLFASRSITRPIRELENRLDQSSGPDRCCSVPEKGPREVRSLIRKINALTARVQALLKNRTTILVGISHDLRTPLARMRVYLELLRAPDNGDVIEMIEEDIEVMDMMIESSMEFGSATLSREQEMVDLGHLVRSVAEQYQTEHTPVQIIQGKCCHVRTNPSAIRRIITNLVENAVKFGRDHEVSIQCQKERSETGSRLLVEVSNRGRSIPAELLETVFEPFYRVDESRGDPHRGSGLGLAVARQLAELHGMQLSLQNRSGGGVVATLMFPVAPAEY